MDYSKDKIIRSVDNMLISPSIKPWQYRSEDLGDVTVTLYATIRPGPLTIGCLPEEITVATRLSGDEARLTKV